MSIGIRTDKRLVTIFKKLTKKDRSYISGVCYDSRPGPESADALIQEALTTADVEVGNENERKPRENLGEKSNVS